MTDIGDNKPRTVRLERRTPFNPPAGLSSGTTSRDARRFRWCMHGLSGVQHDFWLVCTIVAVARVLSGEGDSGSRGKMFDLSRLAPQQIRLFSEKQVPLWQPSPVLARPTWDSDISQRTHSEDAPDARREGGDEGAGGTDE